jgi:hypothetical protein
MRLKILALFSTALLWSGTQAIAAPGETIGSAIRIVNLVTAEYETDERRLATGDYVRQDELIEFSTEGRGELKLRDDTKILKLKPCPKGYVGTPPNCKKLPPILKLKPCPKGYIGTPPNCKKLPPILKLKPCPKGYVGTPPNCKKLPPILKLKPCPKGYVGTPPNCKKLPPMLKLKPCPKGYVGTPPNCKKLNLNKKIRKRDSKKLSKLNSLKQKRR